MTVMDTLRKLIGGASSAIANLRAAEAGIRERLGELEREEQQLLSQPPPPDEVKRNLEALIPSLGQRWAEAHGMDFVRTAGGRIERGVGPSHQRAPDAVIPGQLPDVVSGPLSLAALAGICPDVVLAGLSRVVAATTYESGPALSTRIKRLGTIQEEREVLERQHAELIDRAAESGIEMPHLGAERARRLAVARRHAEWQNEVNLNADYFKRHPDQRPPEPPRA